MVADCGLPSQRIFSEMTDLPENVGVSSTVIVPEGHRAARKKVNTKCAGTGFPVPARWFLCFFPLRFFSPEHRKADEQQIRLVPDLPAAERRDAPGKPAGGDDGGGAPSSASIRSIIPSSRAAEP